MIPTMKLHDKILAVAVQITMVVFMLVSAFSGDTDTVLLAFIASMLHGRSNRE